jgi:hypothetical protein
LGATRWPRLWRYRSVAACHLDKLAGAGLLQVRYQRLAGREGPGAGRPAKIYRRADIQLSVSLSERHDDQAGHCCRTQCWHHLNLRAYWGLDDEDRLVPRLEPAARDVPRSHPK